jgi:hypothetical protein
MKKIYVFDIKVNYIKKYVDYVIYIYNNVKYILLNKNNDRLWEYDNLVLKIEFSKI